MAKLCWGSTFNKFLKSKLSGIMTFRSNNFIKKIALIIAFSSFSLAQTVSFTPAGQGTDYMRYNVATSSGNNLGV